jgi:hypothetical protein
MSNHLVYHKTENLFYRKYPYKLVLNAPWMICSKLLNRKEIENLGKLKMPPKTNNIQERAWFNKEKIEKVLTLLEYSDDIRTRYEGKSLSIFFTDKSLFDRALQLMPSETLYDFYEPVNDKVLEYLLEKRNVVVKKELTHDCRYKINLTNPKTALNLTNKINIYNMIERNPDKFHHITSSFKTYLTTDKRWHYQKYMYVKDDQYLVMFKLIADSLIGEILRIVTEDELNQKENVDE